MQDARQRAAGSAFCLDAQLKKQKLSDAIKCACSATRRQIPARLRHRYRMEE
jgi:hypothetical protein